MHAVMHAVTGFVDAALGNTASGTTFNDLE